MLAIGLTTAVVNYTVLKPTYRAEATAIPRKDQGGDGLTAALLSQAGNLGMMVGSNRSADLAEILQSRKMLDRVINHCNLEKRLPGWSSRQHLQQMVKTSTKVTLPALKNNVLIVSFEAKDPQLAADVANAYFEELQIVLNEIGYNQAAKSSSFIKGQLERARKELEQSESKLSSFQAENRLVSLPDTIKSSMEALTQLEAQSRSNAISLEASGQEADMVQNGINTLQLDPGDLVQLQLKRKSLRAQQAAITRARGEFVRHLSSLPPKALELARLQRDVQIQNAVYMTLTQQYEASMIAEAKESDAFIPLDPAVAPVAPVRPKKLLNILIGTIGGALFGILLAMVLEGLGRGVGVFRPTEAA